MTEDIQDNGVLGDLLGQSGAIEHLLLEIGAFEEVYGAFRAEDPEKFQSVIERARLRIHCERICHWIRTKECVFLCMEVAGPPEPPRELDPRILAKAIARLGENEALVRRLADILFKHDRAGFAEILEQLGIERYAHLFCHWLCTIRDRLVCHWICHGDVIERPVLWAEIRTAARAIGALTGNEKALRTAIAAATAGDPVQLSAAIRDAQLVLRCRFVCEFFCSWRCVLFLIKNAGIPEVGGALDALTVSDFERMLSVNLKGVFLGMKHGIPRIMESGGDAVVNVASTGALMAYMGIGAYTASKSGALGLS